MTYMTQIALHDSNCPTWLKLPYVTQIALRDSNNPHDSNDLHDSIDLHYSNCPTWLKLPIWDKLPVWFTWPFDPFVLHEPRDSNDLLIHMAQFILLNRIIDLSYLINLRIWPMTYMNHKTKWPIDSYNPFELFKSHYQFHQFHQFDSHEPFGPIIAGIHELFDLNDFYWLTRLTWIIAYVNFVALRLYAVVSQLFVVF